MTETIIEILIDYSGSMGYMKGSGPEHENKYLIDGKTRLSLLKKVLIEQVIPTIDYSTKIFIRTFRINKKKVGDKTEDTFSAPIIYQGGFNKDKIASIISALEDPLPGGTPITAAINEAFLNLRKYPDSDRKMILLTDGEENGGGNYNEAVKNIEKSKGIPCKIFIIGIDQDEKSEIKSKTIASGGYFNIKSHTFIKDEIQNALIPLKAAVLQNTLHNINIAEEDKAPDIHEVASSIKNRVEEKIVELKHERTDLSLAKIEEIETKINEYLTNGQKLLGELISIKEIIRINALIDSGLESTTLTIDLDYSESLRQKSEIYLYELLCDKYGINKVRWINQEGEKFEPYDFEILDEDDNVIKLIECKGTAKKKPTFYLTSNEWSFFLSNREMYQIIRVLNVEDEPKAISIDNLYDFLITGKVVPYLKKPEIVKEERVFLTLLIDF